MEVTHHWVLHVLTGVLAGQSVHLPDGLFTLGAGSARDLNVLLPDVPEQYALLDVDEQGVRLQSAGLPCWVNGQVLPAETSILPVAVALDLAGLGIVLVRSDHVAALPTRLPARKGSGAAAARLRFPSLLLVGVLLLSVLSLLLWRISSHGGGTSAGHAPFNLSAYLAVLKKSPALRGVQITQSPDGSVTLSGHCPLSTALPPLLDPLVTAGVPYRNQVVCQDTLVQSARSVLALNGYPEVVVHGGADLGNITMSGDIQADQHWRYTSQQIDQIAGLTAWHVENNIDQSVSVMVDLLRTAGLLPQLSVVRDQAFLMLTGVLNSSQQTQLQQVIVKYQQTLSQAPKVVYQNIPLGQESERYFPSPIVSVGGGTDAPFLLLANGVRVQVGSRLPSGYKIAALSRDRVTLTRPGQWVQLPLVL